MESAVNVRKPGDTVLTNVIPQIVSKA